MRIIDFFRNLIWLLKLPFLASLSSNFSTICLHMLSKFANKSAQKSSIFITKAGFESLMMFPVTLLVLILPFFLGGVEFPEKMIIESDSADYSNDCIRFDGNIIVSHPLGTLRADIAFVDEPGKGNRIQKYAVPAALTLLAASEEGLCQLETLDGKHIEATRMHLDTTARKLHLDKPKGYIIMPQRKGMIAQPIEFIAGSLTWEEPYHMMKLNDHVVINQGDMGVLLADEEIEIHELVEGNARTIDTIVSNGKTVFTYLEDAEKFHTVVTYGKICVNHRQMCITLSSSPEEQVHFQDNFGEFFSDQVRIEYEMKDRHITPIKLILDGHIHIRNQFARMESAIPSQNPLVQYAMADHVIYMMNTKEIIFSAEKGQRVLFYDKLNNVQMSAPVLKMKRDPKTNQDSIKGEGEVRFTFAKNEWDKLQAYFEKGDGHATTH